ncbi:MAG: serine hydrolase domain-containing protein [Candidatus Nanopelagicales bacterium]
MSFGHIAYRAAVGAALAAGLTMSALPAHADQSKESQIAKIVREAKKDGHLKAVIVRVTKGNKVITTKAFGDSMNGVPATKDMRFRNGAVAFAYVSTLLLEFVDQGKVELNDTIDQWLPDVPEADKVTLKMLANQTSGYPDYEQDADFARAFYENPFRKWTYKQRAKVAFSKPMLFEPGTNWSYAHTNFMLLGKILSDVGGKPLAKLLRQQVLKPMGLKATVANQTAEIPDPVLHSFSGERRGSLGVSAGVPFLEESTFWNVAWGTPVGATQTTNIYDMARSARSVGTGQLLSTKSYRAMTQPRLLGFGHKQDNCPTCFQQSIGYNYGLGIVRTGDWLIQNPLLSGYGSTMAFLPGKDVAIAVATTYKRGAFDADGNYSNASDSIFREIGALMAPKDAPPTKK